MLGIVLHASRQFRAYAVAQDWQPGEPIGQIIHPNDYSVSVGNFAVLDEDALPIEDLNLTTEDYLSRSRSINGTGPREDIFRAEVRKRDGGCVFSGEMNLQAEENLWAGFQASHIWGLQHEDYFTAQNLGRWIGEEQGTISSQRPINSIQNGFCMRNDLHELFDTHLISVNVNAGYRIVEFGNRAASFDGKILEHQCWDPRNPNRISPQILHQHFRQAVLANMRGAAGAPIWESDFPPEYDGMAEMVSTSHGKEWFESKLQNRLASVKMEREISAS